MPPDGPQHLRGALARLAPLARLFVRVDPGLYAAWAAFCTLSSGRTFYGYMMKQTGGEWSAPLDDVFIHFDYARATAAGHPFEWVVGNGYSSGNTSATYPFVLALGYVAGFTEQRLMLWAALVAATSVFATLLVARRLFVRPGAGEEGPPLFERASAYLLPPAFLAIGALDWSLWSGMEVAFFAATWAVALLAYLQIVDDTTGAGGRRKEWALGAAGVLMVLTRPEAAGTLFVFGLGVLWARRRGLRVRGALAIAARILGPGAAAIVGLAACNRAFTGDWGAAGALVKLAAYNPFMPLTAKWTDYAFNFRYEIFRNLEYHFTDVPAWGFLLPGLALAAVAIPRTRPVALLLWGQVLAWMAITAFNGQVRWQNERYTMPAVAWLTVAAALGATNLVRRRGRPSPLLIAVVGAFAVQAVLASRPLDARPALAVGWALSVGCGLLAAACLWLQPVRVLCVIAALVAFEAHQAPRMRDQKWFFGRASRNIRDQHIETGRWLATIRPRRVLVGDAGALMYASDRPGLDIIGLGGYRGLPFARAGVQGLTATIELMERLRPDELPDLLAIYPSWWGSLPTWFGGDVLARVPAVGNVICGGYEDVVYAADWHLLRSGEAARSVPNGLSVRDTVDVADLVSEREHGYRFDAPSSGFTELRILADPAAPERDMLDGGRELKPGSPESMRLGHLVPGRDAVLILRTAPVDPAQIRVRVGAETLPPVSLDRHDGWVEPVVRVPARLVAEGIDVTVTNDGPGDFVDYHVWVAQ